MLKPHATLPGLPPITLLRRPFLLLASSSALPRPLLTTHGEQVSHQLRHMLPGTCDCARTPGCTNDFHTLLATHLLSATAGLPPTELTLLASLPSSHQECCPKALASPYATGHLHGAISGTPYGPSSNLNSLNSPCTNPLFLLHLLIHVM